MSKRIGLVHATLNAVQPMLEAFRCHAPELGVLNFLDEGLVALANQSGGVTPAALRRLAHLVEMAATAGVDGVLTTCSAFSPYVPTLAGLVEVPVVSVDRAMLEQAASIGRRVVVVVTVAGAGPAAADQLRAIAGERGKRVEVTVAAVTEAFAALQAQDAALHDRLVAEKVEELAPAADVVVLAQISMARAVEAVGDVGVPVLTSPESGVRAILRVLESER